ncbi:HEAT repeat-containing protein 7A, partial [Ophiophagus hannah]
MGGGRLVPLLAPQGRLLLLLRPQDATLKLCLIRSICLISQAICHSAQSGDFSFSRKAEVVAQMLEFIKAEPPDALRSAIRQRAMTACMYL